ncbi:hypothetical protein QE152_g27834 [Popillia japonica]|uniref:Conotoxin n=1 Tax=Popillia japonica TaxID=7064 RepID=A0AAW1JL95_POPJA
MMVSHVLILFLLLAETLKDEAGDTKLLKHNLLIINDPRPDDVSSDQNQTKTRSRSTENRISTWCASITTCC